MNEYIIPCFASFLLGVGMTLAVIGFCTASGKADERAGYKNECIGYDQKGADK